MEVTSENTINSRSTPARWMTHRCFARRPRSSRAIVPHGQSYRSVSRHSRRCRPDEGDRCVGDKLGDGNKPRGDADHDGQGSGEYDGANNEQKDFGQRHRSTVGTEAPAVRRGRGLVERSRLRRGDACKDDDHRRMVRGGGRSGAIQEQPRPRQRPPSGIFAGSAS